MTTGEIVAVGGAVVVLGGGILFVLHRQNQAALQTAAAESAAAARAARSAKQGSDFDLGAIIVDLGGLLIDKALSYNNGGPSGVAADQAKQDAYQV